MSQAPHFPWYRLFGTPLPDILRGRLVRDWRQTVAHAGLPVEIEKVVTQVVRRSRLWRRERVDVAEELIAHFQDGLAAGRTVEALLRAFGDPLTAAKLIRRAKKRNRSWAWHMANRSF